MPESSPRPPALDQVLLLLVASLFLLLSPLRDWWAGDGALWYAPFLVWGLVILLAWWRARGRE